jgi:hypothetical protein
MTWRDRTKMTAAGLVLAGLVAFWPADAAARGHRGMGRPIVAGGFYGWDPLYFGYGFGYGFGPYLGPCFFPYDRGPAGGVDLNAAMIAGYGAIDLRVKPGEAEVWVDGKYVDEARELDGTPRFLWLPEGAHKLTVRKGGFATFEAPIEVRRGTVKQLKIRMKPGESQPAGSGVALAR